MDKICELLPWFAAGTLSEGERQQVLLHLAKCADCRRELPWLLELSRDIKTTTAALPACRKPAEPPQADYNLRLLEHYSPTVPGVQVTERVYRLQTPFGTVCQTKVSVPAFKPINLASWLLARAYNY